MHHPCLCETRLITKRDTGTYRVGEKNPSISNSYIFDCLKNPHCFVSQAKVCNYVYVNFLNRYNKEHNSKMSKASPSSLWKCPMSRKHSPFIVDRVWSFRRSPYHHDKQLQCLSPKLRLNYFINSSNLRVPTHSCLLPQFPVFAEISKKKLPHCRTELFCAVPILVLLSTLLNPTIRGFFN